MKLIRTAIIIIIAIVVFCFFGWKWGYLQFQLPGSTGETSTPSADEVRGWKDSLAAIEALLTSPDAKNLSSEKLTELRKEFGEISDKLKGLDKNRLVEISDKLKGEVSGKLQAVSRLLKEKRHQLESSEQETDTPKETRTRKR